MGCDCQVEFFMKTGNEIIYERYLTRDTSQLWRLGLHLLWKEEEPRPSDIPPNQDGLYKVPQVFFIEKGTVGGAQGLLWAIL